MEITGIAFAEDLAALVGVDVTEVIECFVSSDGRPPRLLWGYDLVRGIHIVRSGYMSGYLDRDSAWEYLEQLTDYITALFPDEESFLMNLRLGHAHWAGASQRWEIQERGREYASYMQSNWPERLGQWPSPLRHALPPDMVSGFLEFRAQLREAYGSTGPEAPGN